MHPIPVDSQPGQRSHSEAGLSSREPSMVGEKPARWPPVFLSVVTNNSLPCTPWELVQPASPRCIWSNVRSIVTFHVSFLLCFPRPGSHALDALMGGPEDCSSGSQ